MFVGEKRVMGGNKARSHLLNTRHSARMMPDCARYPRRFFQIEERKHFEFGTSEIVSIQSLVSLKNEVGRHSWSWLNAPWNKNVWSKIHYLISEFHTGRLHERENGHLILGREQKPKNWSRSSHQSGARLGSRAVRRENAWTEKKSIFFIVLIWPQEMLLFYDLGANSGSQ